MINLGARTLDAPFLIKTELIVDMILLGQGATLSNTASVRLLDYLSRETIAQPAADPY
jgi:hypothetical protein